MVFITKTAACNPSFNPSATPWEGASVNWVDPCIHEPHWRIRACGQIIAEIDERE
jgi:hypothetical protein